MCLGRPTDKNKKCSMRSNCPDINDQLRYFTRICWKQKFNRFTGKRKTTKMH